MQSKENFGELFPKILLENDVIELPVSIFNLQLLLLCWNWWPIFYELLKSCSVLLDFCILVQLAFRLYHFKCFFCGLYIAVRIREWKVEDGSNRKEEFVFTSVDVILYWLNTDSARMFKCKVAEAFFIAIKVYSCAANIGPGVAYHIRTLASVHELEWA